MKLVEGPPRPDYVRTRAERDGPPLAVRLTATPVECSECSR